MMNEFSECWWEVGQLGLWWVVGVLYSISTLTWETSSFRENSTVKLQIFILRTLLTKFDFYGIVPEGASDLEGFKVGRLQ